MNLTGGKVPGIKEVNPFGVYHDAYDSNYRGYLFTMDFSWVPARGHMIYAELLSNELNVGGERNSGPTAIGYMGGYWLVLPFGKQTMHRIGIEAAHIDTWTYVDNLPYQILYQRQKRRVIAFDLPLGYSYGGDLDHFSFIYTVISRDRLSLDLRLHHLAKGEVNFGLNESGLPYYTVADSSYLYRPSGIVERWNSADILLTMKCGSFIELESYIHYSRISNFGHIKGETEELMVFALAAGLVTDFIF
jgi:hypothetical protein